MDDKYKGYDSYGSYYKDNIDEEISIHTFEDDAYELDYNECILLSHQKVKRNETAHYRCKLVLTNKRMILIEKQSSGFFKNMTVQSNYLLDQIKFYNDQPMVNIVRNHDDEKMVEIQLKDGSVETYRVDDHNSRFTKTLLKEIYGVFGIEVQIQNDFFESIKRNLPDSKEIQDLVDGVGDIVSDLSSSLFGIELGRKTTTSSSSALSKTQIDALKSLKDLLDAGILTQEEFDEKKKKILEQ